MRRVLAGALVWVGVLVWAVQPAAAQCGPFGGGMGGGGLGFLIQNPGVAKELKLTDEQTEKAKEAANKVRDSHKDEFAKLRDLDREERQKKMADLMKTVGPETEKALADVLKPDQMKRLKQIELQVQGLRAFESPEVQKALNLSDEQKNKVKDIAESTRKDTEEAMKDAREDRSKFPDAMKKVTEIRKKANDKAADVLDDSQKKTWKEMTGEPFEMKFERGERAAPAAQQ